MSSLSPFEDNPFEKLPVEVLLYIFSFLRTQDILRTSSLNSIHKEFARDNELWRQLFKRYFPEHFKQLELEAATNWYTAFHEQYTRDNSNLPRNKWSVFSQIKNREIPSNFDLWDLLLQDNNDCSLIEWAYKTQDQSLLDKLYQQIRQSNLPHLMPLSIFWAYSCNQPYTVFDDLISKGSSINDAPPLGLPTLHQAVQRGDKKMVRFLKEKGADMNIADAFEQTALTLAISNRQIEMVCCLIECGENSPASRNHLVEKNYALTFAARLGHLPIINKLMEQEGEISSVMLAQALILAAGRGHTAFVAYLLKKGVDVNAIIFNPRLVEYSSALSNAYFNKQGEVITILLENNASYLKADLLENAIQEGDASMIALLLAKADQSILEASLRLAVQYGKVAIVRYLLIEKSVSANLLNQENLPLLSMAILSRFRKIASLLIDYGADCSHPLELKPHRSINTYSTINKETALHIAVKSSQPKLVVKLIQNAMVDINAQAEDGSTALMHALMVYHKKPREEAQGMIDILLAQNTMDTSKTLSKDFSLPPSRLFFKKGSNALDIALECGLFLIAKKIYLRQVLGYLPPELPAPHRVCPNLNPLRAYLKGISSLDANHHKKRFFGIGLGFPAGEKKAAATALLDYAFGVPGAEAGILQHLDVLNNGELQTIFESMINQDDALASIVQSAKNKKPGKGI